MGEQRRLKKFRKELRKKEKEMFSAIMDAFNREPFWERVKWAIKILRKKC
jgi:hypothetical protein